MVSSRSFSQGIRWAATAAGCRVVFEHMVAALGARQRV
jgi:hypothetical protein